ncbi:MAG: beta-carotene 3-hydroxylase [Rhodothermales bacterium]|jgi:beta-carotene 3-hydroxylase
MHILVNALIVLGTFVTMEAVAWLAHRFVMHGAMWWFHHDHHNHQPGFFEKNDAFALIFAIPSAWFFYSGTMSGDFRIWIGLGILIYGICYVFVHDIFIHQRFKWLRRTNSVYLTAIRKAHYMHHKHLGPEDGECFGMLMAPPKYFREARVAVAARRAAQSGRKKTD